MKTLVLLFSCVFNIIYLFPVLLSLLKVYSAKCEGEKETALGIEELTRGKYMQHLCNLLEWNKNWLRLAHFSYLRKCLCNSNLETLRTGPKHCFEQYCLQWRFYYTSFTFKLRLQWKLRPRWTIIRLCFATSSRSPPYPRAERRVRW